MTRIAPSMTDVRYLVSACFDYSQWLCADAGPQYAASLGLAWEPFNAQRLMTSEPNTVWVLDPRLQVDEVQVLRGLAWRCPHLWLVPRVVDPYWPPEDQNPLRELAFCWVHRPRTLLLLAYEPVEVTALLADAFGPTRWMVSPYPYLASRELALGGKRNRRVVISGSPNPSVYPLRALARRKRITAPRWRWLSSDLAHPGYEPKARGHQGCVGERFVAHLAQFRFMFLCPSRAELEFLKYGECAYAGCTPVGAPARGLPSGAAACILPFEPADIRRSIKQVSAITEQEACERAVHFRRAMASERDAHHLRQALDTWLVQTLGRFSQSYQEVGA